MYCCCVEVVVVPWKVSEFEEDSTKDGRQKKQIQFELLLLTAALLTLYHRKTEVTSNITPQTHLSLVIYYYLLLSSNWNEKR